MGELKDQHDERSTGIWKNSEASQREGKKEQKFQKEGAELGSTHRNPCSREEAQMNHQNPIRTEDW